MQAKEQLTEIKYFVRRLFRDDITGHDYYHMQRVTHLARLIAEEEGADSFICEAAAWLHDVGDDKLFTNPDMVEKELDGLLQQLSLSQQQISAITQAMQDVSFRKGKNPKTLEGKVVQDADRLDAVGAIGIARAFAYSGAKGRPLYHEKKDNHTIQHFYDKLLRIPDKLHTTTAKTIAEDRHQVLKRFLEQFYQEWNYTLENE